MYNRKQNKLTYPMESIVSAQLRKDETAAAFKLETLLCRTLVRPVREVAIPTTPAMREKMTKKPVAVFPKGKYIGNIRPDVGSAAFE